SSVAYAPSRARTLLTVAACHALPRGVGALRAFRIRASSVTQLGEYRRQRLRSFDCGGFGGAGSVGNAAAWGGPRASTPASATARASSFTASVPFLVHAQQRPLLCRRHAGVRHRAAILFV